MSNDVVHALDAIHCGRERCLILQGGAGGLLSQGSLDVLQPSTVAHRTLVRQATASGLQVCVCSQTYLFQFYRNKINGPGEQEEGLTSETADYGSHEHKLGIPSLPLGS